MILKVGRDKIDDGMKIRNVTYKDVRYDEDGWADAKRFIPADYDLVYLKIEGEPTTSGWSTGNNWDGLQIKEEHNILYWKKKQEEKH
jgi:hypothetical protein